jgi:hypothetical protein
MNNNQYVIPAISKSNFPAALISTVTIPFIATALFPIIKIPGVVVLTFFWLIAAYLTYKVFSLRKSFATISAQGISISQGSVIVEISWTEIEKIGIQAIVLKRMNVYEALPYLSIKLSTQYVEKLAPFVAEELGFIQKSNSLQEYLCSGEKNDIFIKMSGLQENDIDIISFLTSQNTFVKALPVIVKTSSVEEYNKLVKENFTPTENV